MTTDPAPDEEDHRASERDYWIKAITASWVLNGITLLTTVAGIVSIVILWNTLSATNGSLNATLQQLQTAKDTEWKQLRAYLTIIPYSPGISENGPVIDHAEFVSLGQSPAYNIQIIYNMSLASFDTSEAKLETDVGKNSKTFRRISLSPAPDAYKVDENTNFLLTKDRYLDLIKSTSSQRIYNWGVVGYDDVFGCHHFLKFCFSFDSKNFSQGGRQGTECPGSMQVDDHNKCEKGS